MLTCQGSQRKAIMVPFTASVEHKNFLKFFPDELLLKFTFKNSGSINTTIRSPMPLLVFFTYNTAHGSSYLKLLNIYDW